MEESLVQINERGSTGLDGCAVKRKKLQILIFTCWQGGKKREQDREGKRTTEPKTEGKMTKLQKIKKRHKREDRE